MSVRTQKLTLLISGILVAVGVVGAWRTRVHEGPTGAGAVLACRGFVENRLHAPATAVFPSIGSAAIDGPMTDTGQYIVTSFVDAQNMFGALVRTTYVCVVTPPAATGEWMLVDLKMTGR